MDNKDMAQKLASLAQLDIDAAHAYAAAIEKVDMASVKERLEGYREDHERHIKALSTEISRLGETPPDYSPDFKGFFIEGFTSLRSSSGTAGALKAMHTNEKLTNKRYEEASRLDLPAGLKNIIAAAWEDERRHLDYVETAINEKVWE